MNWELCHNYEHISILRMLIILAFFSSEKFRLDHAFAFILPRLIRMSPFGVCCPPGILIKMM
jgi:hypothetical protein